MDDSTRRFIAHLPLPQRVSLNRAAEILEDSDAAHELLDSVARGLFSWTHSPASGGICTSFNHLLGTDSELPRVTADTDPTKVFIEGKEVLWRWCVRYEERLQAVELPEKSTIEAREKAVLGLWQSTVNTPNPDLKLTNSARGTKRKTWRSVAWEYVVETFNSGQYATAKDLYNAMWLKAGEGNSPFDRGSGIHRHSLYLREISQSVALKTIQTAWPAIRASRTAR